MKRKKPVGSSWRMDETYIKVNGIWIYLYKAVDSMGSTIDFLLRKHRDGAAAKAFFRKAFKQNCTPKKVTIDKSGSNLIALNSANEALPKEQQIEIRQIKYLNNIMEQDHRFVKKRTQPMLGFKSLSSAKITITGIECIHMIKKDKLLDRMTMFLFLRICNYDGLTHLNPEVLMILPVTLCRCDRTKKACEANFFYKKWISFDKDYCVSSGLIPEDGHICNELFI